VQCEANVFLFVLAVGAFITVTMKTGAIETGIERLAVRYRRSGDSAGPRTACRARLPGRSRA
jgi:uncharacterized ion transporter superfamily protein YfcC